MYISMYYARQEDLWDSYYTAAPAQRKQCVGQYKDSQESIAQLAKRYGLSPNTMANCKNRDHICDTPMAPKNRRFSLLSTEEEAIIVALRKHTFLSALQSTIARLTRSSLIAAYNVTASLACRMGKVISLAKSSSGSSRSGACTSTSPR